MGKYRTVTFDDRKTIGSLYAKGEQIADIANNIGMSSKTLYSELKRGDTGSLDKNQRPEYDAVLAERRYQEAIRRRGRKKNED